MQDLYKLIRGVWPYIGPLIGLISFAWALDIGIAQMQNWLPALAGYVATVRPLWLLLAGLSFYFSYVEIRHRKIPLTVLSIEAKLTLNSWSGDNATLTRTQKIRANREDVTGYHRTLGVESPGEIPKEMIECHISHCDGERQSKHFEGSPSRLELLHRFDPIPRKLHLLGLNTVTRSESVVFLNAYTNDEESHTFVIPQHYRHKRVTIEVYFHPERVCRFRDCEAVRINANGIISVPLEYIPPPAGQKGGPGIRVRIKNPSADERFKILWRYPDSPTPHP